MQIKEIVIIPPKDPFFDEEIMHTGSSNRNPTQEPLFPMEISQICGFDQM